MVLVAVYLLVVCLTAQVNARMAMKAGSVMAGAMTVPTVFTLIVMNLAVTTATAKTYAAYVTAMEPHV